MYGQHAVTPTGATFEEVDALTGELDALLARYKSALKGEGIDRQVENLKRWLIMNRADLSGDGRLSEIGRAWLMNMHDSLMLAAEEIQRLEDEGGIPASKEQTGKTEELLNVVRRINKILSKTAA